MKEVDEILAHFGVKGMHWGQHKADRPQPSEDHAKTAAVKAKAKSGGVKALSNKDLQDAIARMNLEQQYSRLNPTPSKKALKFVADILVGVGKQQAISLVSGIAADQVKKVTNKQ